MTHANLEGRARPNFYLDEGFSRVLILDKKKIGMKVNEGIVILGEFMDRDKLLLALETCKILFR